jgi:hypothetical protein
MKSPREVSLSRMIVYKASNCAVRGSVKTEGGKLAGDVCVVGDSVDIEEPRVKAMLRGEALH